MAENPTPPGAPAEVIAAPLPLGAWAKIAGGGLLLACVLLLWASIVLLAHAPF